MALLGYKAHGSGPEKVVAYNDWMGDCSSWNPVLPYLDTEHFSYAFVDVRGYGRSLHVKGEYTVTEIASDTLELLEHLGWDRFHVAGFSMTGMVTQRLAIDVPDRLKSAVAIAAVSASGLKIPDDFRQLIIDSITDDAKARTLLGLALGDRLSEQWKHFKFQTSRQTRTREAARGYLDMFTLHDFSSEIGRIAVPFLVICGKHDLPEERIDAQRKTFSQWHENIEFAEIDGGHYLMEETPVMLQTLLNRFMMKYAD